MKVVAVFGCYLFTFTSPRSYLFLPAHYSTPVARSLANTVPSMLSLGSVYHCLGECFWHLCFLPRRVFSVVHAFDVLLFLLLDGRYYVVGGVLHLERRCYWLFLLACGAGVDLCGARWFLVSLLSLPTQISNCLLTLISLFDLPPIDRNPPV